MIVQTAKWLSPWERAERLGLDSAAFEEFTMSVATADAVDRVKKSDRSNLKVSQYLCSWLIGKGKGIIRAMPYNSSLIALMMFKEEM